MEKKEISAIDIGRFCENRISAKVIIEAEKQIACLTREKGEK